MREGSGFRVQGSGLKARMAKLESSNQARSPNDECRNGDGGRSLLAFCFDIRSFDIRISFEHSSFVIRIFAPIPNPSPLLLPRHLAALHHRAVLRFGVLAGGFLGLNLAHFVNAALMPTGREWRGQRKFPQSGGDGPR